MKKEYKLIMLDTPIIVSSETFDKVGLWVYDTDYDEPIVYKTDVGFFDVGKEAELIIAGLAGLPSIDFNGLEEDLTETKTYSVEIEELEDSIKIILKHTNRFEGMSKDLEKIEPLFIKGYKNRG